MEIQSETGLRFEVRVTKKVVVERFMANGARLEIPAGAMFVMTALCCDGTARVQIAGQPVFLQWGEWEPAGPRKGTSDASRALDPSTCPPGPAARAGASSRAPSATVDPTPGRMLAMLYVLTKGCADAVVNLDEHRDALAAGLRCSDAEFEERWLSQAKAISETKRKFAN